MPGGGPALVITDLGCYGFEGGERVLTALHPGVDIERVRTQLGWEVRVANELASTEPPAAEELRLLRRELDPDHLYI